MLDRTSFYAESGGQDSDAGLILGQRCLGRGAGRAEGRQEADRAPGPDHRRRAGRGREGAGQGRPGVAARRPAGPFRHPRRARRAAAGARAGGTAVRLVQQARVSAAGLRLEPGAVRGHPQRAGGGRRTGPSGRICRCGCSTGRRPRRRRWARSRCSARPTTTPCGSSRSAVRGRSNCAVAPMSSTPRRSGRWRSPRSPRSDPGLRRVEAAVGIEAFHRLAAERTLVSQLAGSLKVQPSELPGRIEALLERLRAAEKELAGSAGGGAVGVCRDAGRGCGDHRRYRAGRRDRTGGHRRPVTSGTWPPTSRPGSAAGRAWSRSSRPGRGRWRSPSRSPRRPSRPAGPRAIWRSRSCRRSQGRGGGKKDMAQGAGTDPDGHSGRDRRPPRGAGRRQRMSLPAAPAGAGGNPDGHRRVQHRRQRSANPSMLGHEYRVNLRHCQVITPGKACVWGSTSVPFAWGLR